MWHFYVVPSNATVPGGLFEPTWTLSDNNWSIFTWTEIVVGGNAEIWKFERIGCEKREQEGSEDCSLGNAT